VILSRWEAVARLPRRTRERPLMREIAAYNQVDCRAPVASGF
jgi:predicted RecB family nuclease